MEFMQRNKLFLIFFYIIGLSPYFPEYDYVKDRKKITRHFKKIPMILQGCLGIGMALWCAYALNVTFDKGLSNRTDIIIINLFIVCELCRTIMVIIQCSFSNCQIYAIVHTFHKLEQFFLLNFNHRLSYQKFSKQYFGKVFLVLGAYVQCAVALLLRMISYPRFDSVNIQIKTMQAVTAFTFLHIIFFIDVLGFHLDELNVVIRRDMVTTADRNTNNDIFLNKKLRDSVLLRNKLKYYKCVHFRLWEVTQRINGYFGWCMVALLLHAFVDCLYCAYWLFEELQHAPVFLKLLRKIKTKCACHFCFSQFIYSFVSILN